MTDRTGATVLSIGQAARLLGVPVAVLRTWANEGLLSTTAVGHGRQGVSVQEVQRVRARLGFRVDPS